MMLMWKLGNLPYGFKFLNLIEYSTARELWKEPIIDLKDSET